MPMRDNPAWVLLIYFLNYPPSKNNIIIFQSDPVEWVIQYRPFFCPLKYLALNSTAHAQPRPKRS